MFFNKIKIKIKIKRAMEIEVEKNITSLYHRLESLDRILKKFLFKYLIS